MANTSATGGYLPPLTSPVENDTLDDIFQAVFAGISGIDPTLVRPRWTIEPAAQPALSVNWISYGITSVTPDDNPAEVHNPDGNGIDPPDGTPQGTSSIIRHETIEIMLTFYGPSAGGYAAIVRDGLYVNANRDSLFLAGIGLVGVGQSVAVPEFVNQQWRYRRDMPVTFRRRIEITYNTLSIASIDPATSLLTNGTQERPINVEPQGD